MSEIIIAENTGFCSGVKKAVETATKVCGEGVYILGELIHNKSITNKILSTGTKIINNVNEIESGTLIIRSHGVGKDVYEKLFLKENVKVIDCTCQFVKKIHDIVEKCYKEGFQVVIIGEPDHPETIGTNGWCDYNGIFISDENFETDIDIYEKLCVVCQTTFSREKFEKILARIREKRTKTFDLFDTICYTTKRNQEQAEYLSIKCDAMVVIGGKNSSNTNKLYDLCKKHCKNVLFIENSAELDTEKLKKAKKIGIVCGASTPKEQATEVLLRMENTDVKTTEVSMEEVVADMGEQKKFRKNQMITATISSATDDGLMVYLPNTKKEILLKKEELDCETYDKAEYAKQVGNDIQVMIIGVNPVVLSQKEISRIAEEEKEIEEIKNGKVFNVTITAFNKGGLVGKFLSYEVFIPSSQIKLNGFVKDLEKYVGKTLRVKAEEEKEDAKPRRRKQIVASQKVVLQAEKEIRDKEREAKENEFFDSIAIDEILTGKVVRFAPFGAFVNVNGFDCLAHNTDLAWVPVKNPQDILELNKEYDFVVLKIDRENKKVSIGYKQLQPKPWDSVPEKYAVGDIITGKVVRILDFGAFVEVEKGIDGLVHVSQISHEWLENPTSALNVGQEVQAKILAINLEKEKMTLSIKEVTPAPEKAPVEETAETEKPAKSKKAKKEKAASEDGEIRNWNEAKDGGASIFELINNNQDKQDK